MFILSRAEFLQKHALTLHYFKKNKMIKMGVLLCSNHNKKHSASTPQEANVRIAGVGEKRPLAAK